MIKLTLLLSTLLFSSITFASQSFQFKLQINDSQTLFTSAFDKNNNFEHFVRSNMANEPNLYLLKLTSLDIPTKFFTLERQRDGINVKLNYPDLETVGVDFENIGFGELALYLDNEPPTMINNILIGLADYSRIELFKQFFQSYTQELSINNQISFLLAIETLAQITPIIQLQDLLQLALASNKIQPKFLKLVIAAHNGLSNEEVKALKNQVKNDPNLKTIVESLSQVAPKNRLYQYFLN